MRTDYSAFWQHDSFAFVGHTAKRGFPKLSYSTLKSQLDAAGTQRVFAVDPSLDELDGQRVYHGFDELPAPVDAVVLEVPPEETAEWVRKAADAGITNVWVHMKRDTPEAIAVAEERGVELWCGTCAVMYVKQGLSFHSIHRWINKRRGVYWALVRLPPAPSPPAHQHRRPPCLVPSSIAAPSPASPARCATGARCRAATSAASCAS